RVAKWLLTLSTPARYELAIVTTGLAALLRFGLTFFWSPLDPPFVTFYPAVVVSASLGGVGPGVLSTVVSAALASYFWIAPRFSFAFDNGADIVALLVFSAMGVLTSFLQGLWRQSQTATLRSEAAHNATVANIGDAVIAADSAGRVTFMNQ